MNSPLTLWIDACQENWKLWSMLAETATASGQVIAHRLPLMADAASKPFTPPSTEMQRMVSEKQSAFTSAALAFGEGMEALATGSGSVTAMWVGALTPIHARSTGNARRLARRKPRR